MRLLRLVPVLVLVTFLVPVRPSPLAPAPSPAPIRCVSCTQQQLSACPPVRARCAEVVRASGCGCCAVCALSLGDACGVHTAPCGSGLRCAPREGDAQPLRALTLGQGACTKEQQERRDTEERDDDALTMKHNSVPTDESEHEQLHALLGLNGEPHDSIRDRANAIRKKLVQQGPCHTELHSALDTIATSQQALGEKFSTFYLPNCDKHGFYKAKQCETSLVGQPPHCWCVSWNGKKMEGSSGVSVDDLCHQEVTH
ncbi:insulin-like growth factor-binding protein 1b [Hoplias malabaricus]|uniref:insulin-like growth factor-binding protein 1b n=1 Tax=Hoplias malabaricus TaxID=27720 RepID=UPI003461C2C9